MKLFRQRSAAVLMAAAIQPPVSLAGCAATGVYARKKFIIASDASWPPMEFVDDSKNIVGFDIDLINAIAKDQKFEVEIKNTAWDGIFAGLEAGEYDAIISSVTITDDRKKIYDFSDPYFDANQAIVVRADDNAIKSEQDLAGKNVGAQIETTGAIDVGDKIQEATRSSTTPRTWRCMDLVNNNLDAVVVDTPVAANYALQSEQFKGKLKIVGEIVTNEAYGLTVQKGDPKKVLAALQRRPGEREGQRRVRHDLREVDRQEAGCGRRRRGSARRQARPSSPTPAMRP